MMDTDKVIFDILGCKDHCKFWSGDSCVKYTCRNKDNMKRLASVKDSEYQQLLIDAECRCERLQMDNEYLHSKKDMRLLIFIFTLMLLFIITHVLVLWMS